MPQLKVGFACVDITPPLGVTMAGYSARDRGAESVETPLLARALVFESGGSFAALACTDLIGAQVDVSRAIRDQVSSQTGIPPHAINFSGSHTHWGPVLHTPGYVPDRLREGVFPEYVDFLTRAISGALVAAWRGRSDALAGWGTGLADGISFGRRPVGPDGSVAMSLTLPPDQAMLASRAGLELRNAWPAGGHRGPRLSPPIEGMGGLRAGVTDPSVPLLKLLRPDGTPLAGLISFACHPVVGGEGNFYAISPDYPGQARKAFESVVGAPLAFTLGCAGDQVPAWRGGDSRVRVGRSLGAAAARAWYQIQDCCGDVTVATACREVVLPVKEVVSVEEARRALEQCDDPEGPGGAYERHQLSMAERYAEKPFIESEMWALRIGQFALVSFPGEIFAEIGLQVKQRSPFAVTSIATVTYDGVGYISTADAHREGGYEPQWSAPGPDAERIVVDSALDLLTSLA